MALLDKLRQFGGRVMDTLSLPVFGTGGVLYDTTPLDLRPVIHLSESEQLAQQRVVVVRAFHDGWQGVKLTPRLREFLGSESDQFAIRFNLVKKINRAISQRMVIEGIDSTASDPTEKAAQIKFAMEVLNSSRMKGKRARMMTGTVRDGESFMIVDFDGTNQRPFFVPHERYCHEGVQYQAQCGKGEGMGFVYPNGNVDKKPLYAFKRWFEATDGGDKEPKGGRINLYFADRTDRYFLKGSSWVLLDAVPNAETAQGIPAVHVKTPELLPAAFDVIGLQKGENKALVDLFAASDATAFRILIALGWKPVGTDGKFLAIEPGRWIGTEDDATGKSVTVVDPAPIDGQIAMLDKITATMADAVDVPLSLLNRSNQRAAEGTLQEEKESFGAQIRDYQETAELAFEDALRIARRQHNAYADKNFTQENYGYGELDEKPDFIVKWAPFTSRSLADQQTEVDTYEAAGVPQDVIQQRVLGFPAEQTAKWKSEATGDGFIDPRAEVVNAT